MVDAVDVMDVQEDALGASEQAREVLDRITFGGGVDNAEHLFKMV